MLAREMPRMCGIAWKDENNSMKSSLYTYESEYKESCSCKDSLSYPIPILVLFIFRWDKERVFSCCSFVFGFPPETFSGVACYRKRREAGEREMRKSTHVRTYVMLYVHPPQMHGCDHHYCPISMRLSKLCYFALKECSISNNLKSKIFSLRKASKTTCLGVRMQKVALVALSVQVPVYLDFLT